jgi:hypothetical protein
MTHSVFHHARILTLSIFGLVSAVAVAAAPGGCSHSDAVTPKAELIDNASQALSIGSLESIDGTYTNCIERTGSWSLATQVGATLTNAALSVVQSDPTCALSVTAIHTASTLYETNTPIPLTSAYQTTASSFSTTGSSPWLFYANAKMSPANFSADFTVTVLYSDNPNEAAPTQNNPSFASWTSSAVGTGVPSPDYTLADDIIVTADLSSNVSSATGSIDLTFVTQAGEDYVVDLGTLPATPTYDDITTAFSGGTALSGTPPSVAASVFALTGNTLPLVRTLIVRHTVSGVSAYETFKITFAQVQLLTDGASCGASSECSSTFCVTDVCCNTACLTGSCVTGTCM